MSFHLSFQSITFWFTVPLGLVQCVTGIVHSEPIPNFLKKGSVGFMFQFTKLMFIYITRINLRPTVKNLGFKTLNLPRY